MVVIWSYIRQHIGQEPILEYWYLASKYISTKQEKQFQLRILKLKLPPNRWRLESNSVDSNECNDPNSLLYSFYFYAKRTREKNIFLKRIGYKCNPLDDKNDLEIAQISENSFFCTQNWNSMGRWNKNEFKPYYVASSIGHTTYVRSPK